MTRKQLYIEYIKELGQYNLDLVTAPLLADHSKGHKMDLDAALGTQYEDVSTWYDLNWFDIYDGIELVGFILVTTGDHCPPDVDYYISECYVDPKHRNKGIMTKYLKTLFSNNKGVYGLYVLSANKPAKEFWRKKYKEFNVTKLPVRKDSMAWKYNCIEDKFSV